MLTHPSTLPRHREPLLRQLMGGGITNLHTHIAGATIASGRWIIPGWMRTVITFSAFAVDALFYQPIFVTTITTYDRIGINVQSGAAGTVRLGIYEADVSSPNAITPKALVLDAGTVDVTTTGTKQITISETLNPGFYFLAMAMGVTATIYGTDSVSGPMETAALAGGSPGHVMNRLIPTLSRTGVGSGALADPAAAPTTDSSIWAQTVALRR